MEEGGRSNRGRRVSVQIVAYGPHSIYACIMDNPKRYGQIGAGK